MSIELSALPSAMPKMLSGENLVKAMSVLPDYDPSIVYADNTKRLLTLSELYKIYIPASMSIEIYEKLYIALMRALQKKGTKLSVFHHFVVTQVEQLLKDQGSNYYIRRSIGAGSIIGRIEATETFFVDLWKDLVREDGGPGGLKSLTFPFGHEICVIEERHLLAVISPEGHSYSPMILIYQLYNIYTNDTMEKCPTIQIFSEISALSVEQTLG